MIKTKEIAITNQNTTFKSYLDFKKGDKASACVHALTFSAQSEGDTWQYWPQKNKFQPLKLYSRCLCHIDKPNLSTPLYNGFNC